jgi:hypothetical protein
MGRACVSLTSWIERCALALALLGAPAPAAALLLPYSATYTVEIGTFPPLVGLAGGTLDATTAGGSISGFTLPAGVFVGGSVATPITPPVVLLTSVSLTSVQANVANQQGQFSGSFGQMGSQGNAVLFLQAFGLPVSATIPLTGAIGVPGGKITAKVLGLVPLTALANGWTTGSVGAVSSFFDTPSTPTRMGDRSTFTSGGLRHTLLTYVTPTAVIIAGIANIAVFGTLSVDIVQAVPEPGTALLVALALASLAAAGRWPAR